MDQIRFLSEAATNASNSTSDATTTVFGMPITWNMLIIIAFVLGYLAIILEHLIHLNKTISAMIMGVICWVFIFQDPIYTGKINNYI